jgi:hypothetical protein
VRTHSLGDLDFHHLARRHPPAGAESPTGTADI